MTASGPGDPPERRGAGPLRLTDPELHALGEAGWAVRDGAFGRLAARRALADARAWQAEGRLRPAGMGRRGRRRAETRGDLTGWADAASCAESGADGLAALLLRFAELQAAANEQAWLGLETFDLQLALYPGRGETYARHRDAFRGGVAARRLTAIYYLNERWTEAHGGCLRLHVPPRPVDLPPLADRLVLMRSDAVEHEVLPAHAERWAVTAWYHGPRPLPGT